MPEANKIINNKYKLLKIIGSGGMGEVYEAVNIVIGKKVALKVLKRELCSDHDKVKRFHQEAVAAAQLGHPNIIDIYDFDSTEDGSYFIVMEFLEGEPLENIIKYEKILPIPRAIYITKQVLSALDVAHKKGIIHRDIKPLNIFLTKREYIKDIVKLLDFGIAKISHTSFTESGSILGTPHYMSPEQIKSVDKVSPLSDLYTMGVVLYECVTGRLPYVAYTIDELMAAIVMNNPYPKPSELNTLVDSELESIILKGMSFKIEDRYRTAQEFIRIIDRYYKEIYLKKEHNVSKLETMILNKEEDKNIVSPLAETQLYIHKESYNDKTEIEESEKGKNEFVLQDTEMQKGDVEIQIEKSKLNDIDELSQKQEEIYDKKTEIINDEILNTESKTRTEDDINKQADKIESEQKTKQGRPFGFPSSLKQENEVIIKDEKTKDSKEENHVIESKDDLQLSGNTSAESGSINTKSFVQVDNKVEKIKNNKIKLILISSASLLIILALIFIVNSLYENNKNNSHNINITDLINKNNKINNSENVLTDKLQKIDSENLEETLPLETLNEIINNAQKNIDQCGEIANLKKRLDIQVNMIIKGINGKVDNVNIINKEINPELGTCITEIIKNLQFPRFRNEHLVIVYPIKIDKKKMSETKIVKLIEKVENNNQGVIDDISLKQHISKVMESIQKEVNKCSSFLPVTGKVVIQAAIMIRGRNGKAKSITINQYENSPVGNCVIQVINKANFPVFNKEYFQIIYPIKLEKREMLDRIPPI